MGQMKKTKGVLNKQVVGIILLAVAIMAVVLVVLFSSGIFSGKSKVSQAYMYIHSFSYIIYCHDPSQEIG